MSDKDQITEQKQEQEGSLTGGILRILPLDQIEESAEQARTYFDEESLKELAYSIEQIGILEPIIVRPVGNRYQIVAGERRYRAVQLIGGKTITAIVKKMSDLEALIAMTVENLQRQDLDIEDEARNFQHLLNTTGLSQRKLAERLGIDHNYISRRVRMLRKPELLAEYRAGLVSLYGTVKKAEEEEKIETVSQRHNMAQGSLPETSMHNPEDVPETVSSGHNMEQSSQIQPLTHIQETGDKTVSPGHNTSVVETAFLPTMPVGGLIQTPVFGSMENLDNIDAQILRQMINTDVAQFHNIFDRWSKVFSVMPPAEQLLLLNSIDDLKRQSDSLKDKLKSR